MSEHERDNEIFIDADSGFSSEQNSYEVLILQQMKECVKVLSREMTGGQVIHKSGPGGVEKYIEDVRELVINHVDTLRMLLSSYIKKDNKNKLTTIMKEIKKHKDDIGNKPIIIPGRGQVKMKDLKGLNVDDPVWKEFINYKALRYREVFEILVDCYNENKAYIKSLEEE